MMFLRPRLAAFAAIVCLVLALFSSCQLDGVSGHSVSGRVVTSAGTGLAGVTVSAEGGAASTVTDASGHYSLGNLPGNGVTLSAKVDGYVVAARFADGLSDGSPTLSYTATSTTGADFLAIPAGAVTIPLIQGRGAKSPLEGVRVDGVKGVVTMVTRKAAHVLYETTEYEGDIVPQWVSEDGFFFEAIGSDKDGDPATSDGVFVATHDPAYTESKWLEGIPTDLQPGDVVTVSGVVFEDRPENRFSESQAYLTRTSIHAASVVPLTDAAGARVTAPFPDGVVLTFDPSTAGSLDSRTLPWEETGTLALTRAISLFESVEGMVVRVNNPLVTGSTYYNVTGILADGGLKSSTANVDFNSTWRSLVLKDHDFNSELLFADYQKPTWKTFMPIPQVGDVLLDSTGAAVLRGVMDYTADPVFMIRPLEQTATLTGVSGASVPPQGWNFDNTKTWYPSAQQTAMKPASGSMSSGAVTSWRIGAGADSKFKVPWTAAEADHLTVGSFNLENYVNQGKPYAKNVDIANIIVGNMKAPDVVCVMELGDDNATVPLYVNQQNSWALPDGVVTAVKNCRDLVDQIALVGGPAYDFREIDPQEGTDGGAPGNNIRVGFLFRTDRVTFVDRGTPENTYATTAGATSTWPVPAPGPLSDAMALASTSVGQDASGAPLLTQSPGRLQDSSFRSSRKPLAGEFLFKPTGKKFFVLALHLVSKGGDLPLYGSVQPPTLGSEANRVNQARVVNRFVHSILAVDPDAKIIVAGDLNDFPWSAPLKALSGTDQGNQVLYSPTKEFMPANEQFSYSYRGNLQQIDHILISPSLYTANQTAGQASWSQVCFIAHIDSVFSDNNHIQTSDHDALVVRLGGL